MKKLNHFLIKNFELKPQEINIFLMLFLHSFFLGLAGAFYFTPANSVFITNFGSEQLPYAYIAAGIGGYIFTSIYSWFQKRIGSRTLFMATLLFMTIITLAGPILVGKLSDKWLSFFVFIWAWPFLSMVGIECGALSLKFLNLVQVKRIFALFSMGGVLAAMLGYLAIPLLNKILPHPYYLLYISVIGFILGIVFLIMLYNKYPEKLASEQKQKFVKKVENDGTGLLQLIKKDYFKYIFICATLSMTIIYVTDFSFLSTVKIHIAPENISQYLALVYGGLKIGEFVISYFSSRLLSKYGVKLGLLILPIAMVVVVTIAAIIGIAPGVECLMFLILITINKSQERILRRGLDDPAFNILYQPLPDNEKFAVQTKVGVVQQFSTAIAGLFILGVNKIITIGGSYDFKYFMWFFVPVLVAWVISSRNLYLSYKDNIRQILADISKEKRRDTSKYQYGAEVIRKYIKKSSKELTNLAVTILSETNPRSLEDYASKLLESDDEVVKKAVLRNIDPTWRRRIANPCQKIYETSTNPEMRLLSERAKGYLDFSEISQPNPDEFNKLASSEYVADKIKLIKYMFSDETLLDENIILSLLDSTDKNVKSAAITLAGKLRTQRMIDKLISLLESIEYYNIAGSVLLDIGDKVLPSLNDYFERCLQPTILLRIIELYGKFGSSPARAFLIKNINYPNREVQQAVIGAMYFCKFQATEVEDIDSIKLKISETVENIVWIMSSIEDLEDEKNTLKLIQALDLERQNNLEQLFLLLSFIYEPRIIALIQKNIIGKNTIFALEIIDNFFSQDIKQLVSPLFDDMSAIQKIKKLSHFFPQEKFSSGDRLKEIIKRDYNRIDNWTVSKAVELLGKLHKSKTTASSSSGVMDYKDLSLWIRPNLDELLTKIRKSEMPDEIFLCLYHTDEMVYSSAAKIIYEENPIKCSDYLINMSGKKQQLLSDLSNNQPLLIDKVKNLKKHPMFFNVPENLLVKMAEHVRIKRLIKGEEIMPAVPGSTEDVIIILKGELCVNESFGDDTYFYKNTIIIKGLNLDQGANVLIAKKESLVLLISRFEYFNILINETDMIRYVFDDKQTRQGQSENENDD
ncbi:MAG: MFS transporter [Bacteroidales bacterium]|nr:MFS transporter [Bacteroidales bacterium]